MTSEEKKDKVELVLLRSVTDNYELDIISGLMEEAAIPIIVKERGVGGHMKIVTGSSLYGTDIYVDKLDYKKANDLLERMELDIDIE